MIVEFAKFVRASRGSGEKILCMCDICGFLQVVPKQNILRPPRFNYTLCRPCHLKSRLGTKHVLSPAFSEGVRRGHLKRDKSTYPLRGFSGEKNGRWNPDRDLVAKRKKARKAMYSMLRRCEKLFGTPRTATTYEALGYSPDDLCAHLEAQFQPGMTWGDRGAWHIDHREPVARFVAEGVADPKIINALSNLRPLWKGENLSRTRRASGSCAPF